MTPWMKPTPSQRATSSACRATTADQQGAIGLVRRPRLRVVPRHHVIGELPEGIRILARLEVLEGAHPHMAARHARQHGAGQGAGLAKDGLPGGDRRQGARRRDAEGVHGLAQDVLPQDRPEPGPAVTPPGEGRAAGTLELDVEALARRVQDLAQENRPAIAEPWHEAAELVTGVGHGQGVRPRRHLVAREHGQTLGRAQGLRVQAELIGKGLVELDEPGLWDRNRRLPGEEALR